ncbi:HMG box-containing protein 4 [Papilio machaon]|uniref:HMG box-containing protein 4 n=1 Tax=Papilio machaon TaxID=76193 RepID=A0A0N0PE91_PAPMA|nr:HMG box-containing protein 4 [Papilio machaon]
MDFESPDDIETRFRRQTPVKSYAGFKQEEPIEFHETPQKPAEDAGTASGSESDFYENNGENAESMESDSSASDEGTARTPANSLYMMEKSNKKKLIIKDGKVIGRAKAQRKDKGKTRITAYMMWAKEARNDLLRQSPNMDFSAISKKLGEMWANVTYNERYLWKRKAKRFAMQKEQSNQVTTSKIISNPSVHPKSNAGPGRPPANRARQPPPPAQQNTLTNSVHLDTIPQPVSTSSPTSVTSALPTGGAAAVYRVTGCGTVEVAAHLRLLGESLAIIGERLKEHEGQIAVSGSVSVLLDTLLCSLAPLLSVARALPPLAPPAHIMQNTLHNIAYIMPGL